MKRQLATHTVESSDNFERQAFTVDFSAEMFNLISNTLYSRPIEAIVRELSCNAYDSHVSNGNPEVPFDVKIPTRLNSEFHVRDYGTGLTPQEVKDVYTVVFKSDKTNTNDLTGCFGVGSKSPFSYATQFSVESIVDGTQWIYSCFLDENGIPCIVDMSNGGFDTDEANGVKISFDVKSVDHYSFADAARKSLQYFKHAPNVSGASIDNVNYSHEGEGYAFRDGRDYYMKPIAVMGNVAYEIDATKVNVRLPNSIVMYFDLGELTPAASREYLQYGSKTPTNKSIESKFNQIIEEMKIDIQKEIDDCKTLYEARVLAKKHMRSTEIARAIMEKVTWKGDDFKWGAGLGAPSATTKMWTFNYGEKKKASYFPIMKNMFFVIPDVDTLKHKKTALVSKLNPSNSYIVPTGTNQAECEAFVKEIGLSKDNVLYVSQMDAPPKVTRVKRGGVKMGVIRKFKPRGWGNQSEYWENDVSDVPDHAYYVIRKINRIMTPTGTEENIEPYEFASRLKKMSNLGLEFDVYSVTKSNADKVPDGWKLIWDDWGKFEKWMTKSFGVDALYDSKKVCGSRVYKLLRNRNIKDPRFKKIKKIADKYWADPDGCNKAIDACEFDYEGNRKGRELIKEMLEAYPLLVPVANSYHGMTEYSEEYEVYINSKYKGKS